MTQDEMKILLDMFDDRLDIKLNPIIENQTKMQEDIKRINATIEHEIDRAIKVTMEGHADLNRKFDKNLGPESRVETLEHKVSALEYVAKK